MSASVRYGKPHGVAGLISFDDEPRPVQGVRDEAGAYWWNAAARLWVRAFIREDQWTSSGGDAPPES